MTRSDKSLDRWDKYMRDFRLFQKLFRQMLACLERGEDDEAIRLGKEMEPIIASMKSEFGFAVDDLKKQKAEELKPIFDEMKRDIEII